MKAIISNKQHPDWGCVSVPLPIPDEEYAHCIELLAEIGLGGVRASDCYIDQLNGAPPVLNVLKGREVNIDELDFLARSIDRYDARELAQFQCVVSAREYRDMMTLINLSFCCDAATVITDFSDLERIGKQHYLDTHGGATTEEYNALNGEEIARQLFSSTEGKITPYGVLYENRMRLEPVYTGQNFPAYADKEYDMNLEILPPSIAEYDTPPLNLFLPMPEKRLERGGYQAAEDIHIASWWSELHELIQNQLNMVREDVSELNRMLLAVSERKGPDMDRLCATVLMAHADSAMEVKNLAKNLELFDFIPNIRTPEELGRFMIRRSGSFDYDPKLEDYYDYAKCGKQKMREQSGTFTELGYIGYTGTLGLDELMMDDPAEQYQREQEEERQAMGGLSQ